MKKLPQRINPVVDHPDWVARLGKAGARFIQLRMKSLPQSEMRGHVRTAIAYAQQYDVSLVLNDYWKLALEEGLTWIHLGQEDLDTADIDAIKSGQLKLGISTHSHKELDRALTFNPDYVALGPIWKTRLKNMAFGPQGVEKLREWKKLIGDLPLVAIGGVTCARATKCIENGADCVSAVSDFLLHDDPQGQVKSWLKATGDVD